MLVLPTSTARSIVREITPRDEPMKRCFGLALAGGGLAAACGGSTSTLGGGGGSAAVNGKAGGTAFDVVEAVGLVGTQTDNGTTASYAGVAITNIAGTCTLLQR